MSPVFPIVRGLLGQGIASTNVVPCADVDGDSWPEREPQHALRADGSLLAWLSSDGRTNVPHGNKLCVHRRSSPVPADDPLAHVVAVIRELRRIAESPLPPQDKLGLLCAQIGAAVYWLEQMDEPAGRPHGPHWRDARLRSDSKVISHEQPE